MNLTKCNNRFCALRHDCWTFNRLHIAGTTIVTYHPDYNGQKQVCEHKLVIKGEID